MSVLIKSILKDVLYLRQWPVFCETCSKRYIHQYRAGIPWKNTLELSEFLIKSVTYNDNGLLVLNKPYGITFSRDGTDDKSTASKRDVEDSVFKKEVKNQKKSIGLQGYYSSGVVNDSLNLVDCLPYLKEHFGFEKLHIARVPEKHMSGVAILTTSKELVEHVNKCRAHLPTGKDRYLAVVVGKPRYSQGKIKLGFHLEQHPKLGKRVVLLQKWSNKAYKRGEIRIGTFHFQTLCSGNDNLTSLVQIAVELRAYHAYRVFCADYLLSPVLGDNLFGGRVQTVLGVPTTVSHFSEAANGPQKLPNEIYSLLGLTKNEAGLIPVHLHLSEMLLPRFPSGAKSVLLTAPPPPHFQWTCDKLGLTQPTQVLVAAAESSNT